METRRHGGVVNRPGPPGLGVNASGGPALDPTANVIALSEAANKRQDDLREANDELTRARIDAMQRALELHDRWDIERHVADEKLAVARDEHRTGVAALRAEHAAELRAAEAARVNSIREVDREDVAKSAATAQQAISTLAMSTTALAERLAASTAALAETLRGQVASTAQAAENRLNAVTSETNKRLTALELAMSEGRGKQTVEDPRMERLTTLVDSLSRNNSVGAGKSEGVSATMAAIVTAIGVAATVLTIYAFTQRNNGTTTFTPAPTTTTTTGQK